jgi:uncharacterized RDD family membrane protein YckC
MPENSVFCSQCGAQNLPGGTFCQKCGAGLASIVSAAAPGTVVTMAHTPAAPADWSAYGGFWIRVAAQLLDGLILGAIFTPIFLLFILPVLLRIIKEANSGHEPPVELFGVIFLLVPITWIGRWLYDALLTSSTWQGTVGKRVLHLKVTDEAGNKISFGRATGRFFGKLVSGMAMDIGFIMVAFTDRKRGLHDMIAGTVVMKY